MGADAIVIVGEDLKDAAQMRFPQDQYVVQ
jgi:hypothetical protein